MPTKTGKGGAGQEQYDPQTGKYIGTDKLNNLDKFHAGSNISSDDIKNMIFNGDFGQDFLDHFKSSDKETQEAMIEYVHSEYDAYNTGEKMNENYQYLSSNEYHNMVDEAIANSTLTPDDREAIQHYIGSGSTSFYLNTAARFGYDEMRKQFMAIKGFDPETNPGNWLSRKEVDRFLKAAEKGSHDFQLPKAIMANRYVGTGPIVSWFKDTGVLDGLDIESTGFHDHLKPGFDYNDLADRLSKLKGTVMPKDGSFMSVSLCPELSHMKGKEGAKVKPILMKIDLPKGQNVYVSNNRHESEGMLPSDIELYIKDVKVENEFNGRNTVPRVVIYYGVK